MNVISNEEYKNHHKKSLRTYISEIRPPSMPTSSVVLWHFNLTPNSERMMYAWLLLWKVQSVKFSAQSINFSASCSYLNTSPLSPFAHSFRTTSAELSALAADVSSDATSSDVRWVVLHGEVHVAHGLECPRSIRGAGYPVNKDILETDRSRK